MIFEPVTPQNAEKLRPYYINCDYRLCEYSVGVKLMRIKSTPCRSCETDAGWRDGCSLCFCSPEPPRTCLPTVRG